MIKPFLFAAGLLAASAASATAAVVRLDSVGGGLLNAGGGFVVSPVPGSLRVGLVTANGISPGEYQSVFEFSMAAIPSFATITSAYLSVQSVGPAEQTGQFALRGYFGDGVISASDLGVGADVFTYSPGQGLAFELLDITAFIVSEHNIGAAFIGFSARQTPLGVCRKPYLGWPGECSGIISGEDNIVGNDSFTPDLIITYTTPPDPGGSVPEPSSWALMLTGFGLLGATLRRRPKAVRA